MTEEDNKDAKNVKEAKQSKPTIRKATTGAWWKSVGEILPKKSKAVDEPVVPTTKDEPEAEGATSYSSTAEPVAEVVAAPVAESLPEAQAAAVDTEAIAEPVALQKPIENEPTPEQPPVEQSKQEGEQSVQEIAPEGSGKIQAPAATVEDTAPITTELEIEEEITSPAEAKDTQEQTSAQDTEKAPKEQQKGKGKPRGKHSRGKKKPSTEEKQDKKAADRFEEEEGEEGVAESTVPPIANGKLLINAEEPEECRIALVEEGKLESFHVSTVSRERTKNNIYKGTIVSIEPNLQAAFVDMGTGRNGFLPFNEIHPEYFRQDVSEHNRKLIADHQWKKLKIEEVVKKGQEVLVQVVKEVTGNKGANITTYLSLPGRLLVLMPGSDSAGISRKIVGEERRSKLREMMNAFHIPEGIGYIIRTASVDITKRALQKDLRFLLRLWEDIKKRGQTEKAPALVYEDEDIVTRFLRDHFTPEIKEITVDTDASYERVSNFVKLLPSKQQTVKVKMHRGAKPIFNQHNIEEQIESIFKPQVSLPSGGSIVIDPTEALVAIDVNSGRTSKNADFEETIFLANMEAAAELARQLRLRDLGGLVVVDFIDMRNKKHIREVERQVRTSMKRDKAKVDTSKISRFGLMQISRQKMGTPIEKGSYRTCNHCQGRGVVRSVETLALYYLRRIQTGVSRKKVERVECRLPLDVAQYLLNKKRYEISELELKHNASIDIIPMADMKPADNHIEFNKNKSNNGSAS